MNKVYDVTIIGGGVIGCAIARQLSRYNLDILVLEKENDVACGSTKANSGIVHGGYDAKFGTLKGELSASGNKLFDELDKQLNFGLDRCGSFVLAFDEEDIKSIEYLYENGKKNNIEGLKIIEREEILKMEPHINKDVKKALYCPSAGIIMPFEYAIALAENAILNGVKFIFSEEVVGIKKEEEVFSIIGENNTYHSKYIINAAGIYADKISRMIAKTDFEIIPRRGEYMLFDKTEGYKANTVIFQTPKKGTKGILVTPTLHKNLMIGPSGEFIEDKEDIDTTREVLETVFTEAKKSLPELDKSKIITQFSGLRASTTGDDFIIEHTNVENFINASCICSPGLTTSYAIALKVEGLLRETSINLEEKEDFNPYRKGYVHFEDMDSEEINALIKEDSSYGSMICRCEGITKGHIKDALSRGIYIDSVDGIKRRIRAGMGRCQGGFCMPRVMEIIKEYNNIDLTKVSKKGGGSYILTSTLAKGVEKNEK